MASYQAKIDVIVSGLREAAALEGRLEAIQNTLTAIKKTPIDLNLGGRGSLRDLSGKLSKEVNDVVRSFVNGEAKFGKSVTSVSRQFNLLNDLLSQTAIKGSGTFDKQTVAVRNLASVTAKAYTETERLNRAQQNLLRTARGLQTINERDAELISRRARVTQGRAKQQRIRESISNAVIGGAFPLLFGQGAGSAVGGGLGGAVGGLLGGQFGFGLSLVGTAVGQSFDNATQSAGDFAKALKDTGDASDALETALGSLDKDTRTLIQNLAQSGQTAAAAEASFQALADRIGRDQAEALKRAGEAANDWGTKFQTWLTKTYANVVLLAEAIRTIFPTSPGSVFDLIEGQPPQELSKEAQARIEDLTGQNNLLEKQVELSRLTTDASIDQRLQLERQIALQEYVNDAVELERQLKEQSLAPQEATLRLKAAELRFTQQIYDLENTAQQARQRKAEEDRRAAEKAQREAERAAERQLQILNNVRTLQVSLIQQSLESADVDIDRTRAVTGEVAATKELLDQQQARLNLEARILDIQLEKALSAKDITDQERTLYEAVYKQQKANLEAQFQTKYRILQLDLARLQTARQIAFAEGERTLQDVRQQRGTQLTGLQTQLAFPFGGEELDAANQALDQVIRRYETLVPIQRALQNLETERSNIATSASKEELQNLDEQIASKVAQIELESRYLTQLDATEKALLRQQQIYAKYGFIADEISSALSDSITGLIAGTTTVAEAFGRMFENIGKAFIDMATQMLAQQLFLTVLSALGGGGGGFGAVDAQGRSFGMLVDAFADGGFVTGPTNAVIGEGGEPEYVIPASKMRTAMGRYAAGARGEGVISGNGTQNGGESGGSTAPTQPIDVRYSVERINNVDYVTADQFRRGMAEAAQQGAAQGETRALRKLQMSSSTRRRVGV